MSDEIVAIVPRTIEETQSLAKHLSVSTLLPSALRQKPADIVAIVIAGSELGIGPMTAIRGMDVIGGQIAMRSAMIGGLVQRSSVCEYLTPVEMTSKVATFKTKRRGSPEPVTMSYTIEEAKTAGLTGKDNWRKDPVAMLLARARARICRAVYPDLVQGLYDPDELDLNTAPERVASPEAEALKNVIRSEVKEVVDAEIVKTEPVEIAPEPVAAPTEPAPTPTLAERVKTAPSIPELLKLVPDIKTHPDRDALKAAYYDRQKELTSAAQ
jgi:hypothetical protein